MSVQKGGEGDKQGKTSNLPSYFRHPDRGLVIEHENEPGQVELRGKRAARQKNADQRFNSPLGFHEPKYKKVSIIERYPLLFRRTLVTTCLLLFFSKPLYDGFVREPEPHEVARAEFLKKKMQKLGWWDNPFSSLWKKADN